jgi:hypothetical protein
MRITTMAAATAVGMLAATGAGAATYYTDQAAFLAAAGPTYFESFENPISADASLAIYANDLTVHCAGAPNCLLYTSYGPTDGTHDVGAYSPGRITFGFDNPVKAFGIFVIGAGTVDGATLSLTTDKGSATLYPFYYNPDFYNVVFEGVIDPTGFSVVTLDGSDPFDYAEYDSLYYGSNPIPGVPEPAVWGLMIAGFAMAGASLRARRAAVA